MNPFGKHVRGSWQMIPWLLCVLLGTIAFLQMTREWERNTVVRVPDGDSIDLADGRRIRLLGIDAPERGRCGASESAMLLYSLTKGRAVRLKNTVKDDYGRILANVIILPRFPEYFWQLGEWTWGKFVGMPYKWHAMVNEEMVAGGFAKYSSVISPYSQLLKNAEKVAKANKYGIWSDGCRGFSPPSPSMVVKGNIRAGVKKYYLPTCRYYTQVIIDQSFGDRWFGSAQDAQNAGFEPGCPE